MVNKKVPTAKSYNSYGGYGIFLWREGGERRPKGSSNYIQPNVISCQISLFLSFCLSLSLSLSLSPRISRISISLDLPLFHTQTLTHPHSAFKNELKIEASWLLFSKVCALPLIERFGLILQ